MRLKSFLLIAAGLFCMAFRSQATPHLDFDGTRFYLAYAPQHSEVGLREYLPKGESLEHWNRLLSERYFKHLTDPEAYVKKVGKVAQGNQAEKNYELFIDKGKGLYAINFLSYSEKEGVMECNIMQVHREKELGLVLYQYAWRVYGINKMNEKQADAAAKKVATDLHRMTPLFLSFDFKQKE
ncbi:MAG: hypothetical protein ABI254_13885 [Chthoniobacterales bacterium]